MNNISFKRDSCKDKLVIDKEIPIIFYCVKNKWHKGKHQSFLGYPKVKKRIFWEVVKYKLIK